MTGVESLPRRIAGVARSLQAQSGSEDTLDLAVQLATEVVEGAEEAAITLVRRAGLIETRAATSQRAARVDQIQGELDEGPGLSAVWDEQVLSCPDLVGATQWPQWAARTVGETGIRSMLAFRMFTQKQRLGVLSLYATEPHAFDGADVESGLSLAAHTAIAITVARYSEDMETALDSRSVIGQATGILMERYDIDAVRAFAALKRISQQSNVKLHRVAADLISTRLLPP